MAIEIINNQHPLFQSVKDLGRKYATKLGFMPDGGFDDYGKKSGIIIASENGILQGYLLFRDSPRYNKVNIVHLCVDAKYRGTGISGNTALSFKIYCKDYPNPYFIGGT